MAWTPAQQAAIDKRGANILVSAAAGSGKTAVLTERVLKRIMGSDTEAPIEIDRFLIVTFTSAAAGEMKERITAKLGEQMQKLQLEENMEDPKVMAKVNYLERQMALVHKASISTIHSFCLKTIKAYFNRLDIDPNIKVGNQAELEIMKMEILEELLEECFEEEDEDFLALADVYGNVQGMATLIRLILDVYTFSKSTPFPEEWLKLQVRHLKTPYQTVSEMPWADAIKQMIYDQIKDIKIIYKDALALCNLPNGPMLYGPTLENDVKPLENIDAHTDLDTLMEAVKQISFAALPRKKQECDEALKEKVKAYRDLAKEVVKDIQSDLAFVEDPKLSAQLPKVGELMEKLVALIKEFEQRYSEAKQKAGVVDYSDLEHLCMKLLVEPEFDEKGEYTLHYTDVAKELGDFYKEVYIDEYQDSNTVQETILGAVANANKEAHTTRFMVGDMKQSIYRFRLANPLIFAEKYQKFDKHQLEESEAQCMQEATSEGKSPIQDICIDLSQNFRSRDNILQGVNDIFEQVMSTEVGELEYDDYAKLYVGNLYNEGNSEGLSPHSLAESIEVHVLETKEPEVSTEGEENSLEDLKKVECEALMVAGLIDKLLKGEGNPTHIFDKEIGDYRKVEPRDIVILLRATKEKASIFETALINRGIGAYADVSDNFFEAIEIQTIISYLQIIDNPLQDIPLLTVLRSPIVGLKLDDLVHIRKTQEEGCFFEALEAYLQREDAKESVRVFRKQLELYREASADLPIEELIAKLYVETGYYRYVSMLPTGAKKKANLSLLKKYAAQYENMNNGKLFGFLQYVTKLQQTTDGLQEAKLVGESENLVRIMSIHKSKGLEFSVVFLCDTGKKFNHSDIMKNVLLHNDLGIAPDYMDTEMYVRYPTIPKIAIKNKIISENISEEMRVLYVALTRPKEKLFITGTVSDMEKAAKKWSMFARRENNSILPLGVKKAGSYLNWIGMSLYAHSEISAVRSLIGDENSICFKGKSKWQLTVWDKASLGMENKMQELHQKDERELLENWDAEKVYGDYKEEIDRRLSFTYPHEAAIYLPTKLSVSEIKREAQKQVSEIGQVEESLIAPLKVADEMPVPHFIKNEEVIAGAKRGTLIHSIFEHLDFLKFNTYEAIKEELIRLIGEKQLQEEVLQVVSIKRLVEMANSKMVQRMKTAKHVWKEKQFIYLAKANEVSENYPEDEEILIQGIVDTFFLEEDGLVIIDYKTDYVAPENQEESIKRIKARYTKQLDLYEEALHQITGIPVKEKVIYLYNINQWINC